MYTVIILYTTIYCIPTFGPPFTIKFTIKVYSCKHGNKALGCIKKRIFVDQIREISPLKHDLGPIIDIAYLYIFHQSE